MKKIFAFLFIGFLYRSVSAQITITAANSFQPGDTVTLQRIDTTGIVETAAGANVTANFASVTSLNTPVKTFYQAPSQTPYGSSFPTATVGAHVDGTISSAGVQYMKATSSTLELLGVGTSMYTLIYSNPQTLIAFPVTYNSTVTDDFIGSYTANGITTYRTGTSTTTADAHGILTTPNGAFSYLRLKTVQDIRDSINFMGNPQIYTSSVITYNYMSNKRKTAVMSISYISSIQGDTKTAHYDVSPDMVTTAAEELPNPSMMSAFVYPNPATAEELGVQFNLEKEETVNVSVMDLSGKVVYNRSFDHIAAGANRLNIGNQDLKQGVYFVNLLTGSGLSRSVKVMIR